LILNPEAGVFSCQNSESKRLLGIYEEVLISDASLKDLSDFVGYNCSLIPEAKALCTQNFR
jgi:hypothetical protein